MNLFKKITPNYFLFFLMILCFFLYSLWAITIPFGKAPDEIQRYDVGNFIFQYHELPVAGDERLFYGGYGTTYATTPYLPYLLGGVLMIIMDFFFDIENLYLVPRLVSVISGVLSVMLVFKICKGLKLGNNLTYFVTSIFAFVPGYAFVNSYVNQDSFAILINLFVIFTWVKGEREGWAIKNYVYTGISLAICLLTYLNGYIIIPVTVMLLLFHYFHKKQTGFWKKLLFLIIPIVMISGWFFVRNYMLYDGDMLGVNYSKQLSEKLATEEMKPSNRLTMQRQGVSIGDMLIERGWLVGTYRSFWGMFGHMDTAFPLSFYIRISTLHFVAILGFILLSLKPLQRMLFSVKGKMEQVYKNSIFLALFMLIPLAFMLSIYYSYTSDFQYQGRYVYTALFPIILFSCLGISKLITPKLRPFVYVGMVGALFFLNLYAVFKLLLPNYYPI
ncbi:phospholipid carrier-dependent glycosyltransferase [Saccharibacillus deserti]|uniref:phospholipid carrier-dependent glycosyltransferase n=1 Tax=Saccharibacillus deserti TaxID=1634444 RepID=UPI0015526785|nr:phospholipid carrier-dependent glycosyltransferase [Saccharibacillus deserti]